MCFRVNSEASHHFVWPQLCLLLLSSLSPSCLSQASEFLLKGPERIGSVYKKAMFRQFTDASYSLQSPRPAWLGFLGPIIRAEVGEVIVVHLKNFASRNYSMHPHGVFYEKNTEGTISHITSSLQCKHYGMPKWCYLRSSRETLDPGVKRISTCHCFRPDWESLESFWSTQCCGIAGLKLCVVAHSYLTRASFVTVLNLMAEPKLRPARCTHM